MTVFVGRVRALTIQHYIAFFHAITMEVLIYTIISVKQHNLETFPLREQLSLLIKTPP